MKTLGSLIFSLLFVFPGLFLLKPTLWAASAPDRQELLNSLVEGARKEGELAVFGSTGAMGEDGVRAYVGAFKKRFGLDTLRVKYVQEGMLGEVFGKAITETKMGLRPTYDVMHGTDHRVVVLEEAGGVERIDHWQLLLPAGVDPKFASPPVVAGWAFLSLTRLKANSYNEKLISYKSMPRTTRDVGLPVYKDKFKFYTSPWPTAAQFGVLLYPKEEWLEILRGWGRNKVTTLVSRLGIARMALGEFSFEPFGNSYEALMMQDKGSPHIAVHLFEDVTPLSYAFNVVVKNARNPNTAKLFVLWATGTEAVQVFEKYSYTGNYHIKESRDAAATRALAKKHNGKVISWFDSPENLRVLKWYATKEGQDYEDQIAVAMGLK